MRNALVLVPLCIGLTFGFIVPTSTSEANNSTESIITLKQETTAIDDEIIINNSFGVTENVLQLHNITHDGAQWELYNDGSEENKIIDERSFILVNQWWRKQSSNGHIIDTKISDSLLNDNNKKKSYLDAFREDPRENKVSVMGAVHMQNFNEKQEDQAEYNERRNKSIYTNTHRIGSRINLNQGARSQYHSESKLADSKKFFVEFLKTWLVKHSMKSNENIALAGNMNNLKYPNKANMKNIIELNTINHNKGAYKNKKQNIAMQHNNRYDNIPLYRNKVEELINELDNGIVTKQKLFHLLLED